MSDTDRGRWDQRYAEGSYRSRPWPSPFLSTWVERLGLSEGAPALDIACGLGRNARFLARSGFDVIGQDISEVALQQARDIGREEGIHVAYEQADFDTRYPEPQRFAVISCIRFMNRQLHPHLPEALAPGGWLLFEHHYITDADVSGPPDDFRLRPQELLELCQMLSVTHFEERGDRDRDGRSMALSRIVAQRR